MTAQAKERPILFSGPMVRAILEGRKTQTRRIVKVPPSLAGWTTPAGALVDFDCPHGMPGARLWVRETCHASTNIGGIDGVRYMADSAFRPIENTPEASAAWVKLYTYNGCRGAMVPSIHMPRWASRILLDISAVRVERLQEISETDARAEGAKFHDGGEIHHSGWRHDFKDVHRDARSSYARLWEEINGPGSWTSNPFVWVIEFLKIAALA